MISAKEKTKAKFDQLVKAALEEARLNASIKMTKKFGISSDDATDANYDDNEEDILQLAKNKRKEDREGLLNPAYEEDNLITKYKKKNEHKQKSEVRNDLKGKNESENHIRSLSSVAESAEEMFVNGKPKTRPRHKQNRFMSSADVSVSKNQEKENEIALVELSPVPLPVRRKKKHPKITEAGVRHVVTAEIHGLDFPETCGSGSVTESDSSVLTTPFKSNKREARRRKKQLTELSTDVKEELFEIPLVAISSRVMSAPCEENVLSSLTNDAGIPVTSDDSILGILIHRADRLQMNFNIRHPLVRVNIIDGNTGTHTKKSDKEKSVTSAFENKNAKIDYIMPVMTQPCDLKLKRFPVWDETLYFNEEFSHFTTKDSNVIIFFEILDFLPMSLVNSRSSNDGGWYRIAWAFLKVLGANNILNAGRKVRLQLYYPPKRRIRLEPRVLDVYHWWAYLERIPYPATLYVSVLPVSPPKNLLPALRSLSPMQEERGCSEVTRTAHSDTTNDPAGEHIVSAASVVHWSRLPGQVCKVPNKHTLSLPTSRKGCLTAEFSNNGKFIACGCQSSDMAFILIYELPSGELMCRLQGHANMIYSLCWAKGDGLLLSASADATARIWTLEKENSHLKHMLPHPSFVYCAKFHPHVQSVIATGCYDSVIRVWNISYTEKDWKLIQELDVHCGHVNCMCFDPDGLKLFSGDSLGVICVWNVYATNHPGREGVNGDWTLCHKIEERELKGISINTMVHHPNVLRILVQLREGSLRMFDYELLRFIQTYKSYINLREHVRGCISPCGNLVFTGCEEGRVHVWNTITGDVVASYDFLPHSQTVHYVAYHPLDHIVAFCYHGTNTPVLVYKHDSQVPQLQVNQVQPHKFRNLELSETFACFPQTSTPAKDAKRSADFNLTSLSTGSTCYEKIMQKLDSVLENKIRNLSKSVTADSNTMLVSWDTTFDRTLSNISESEKNVFAVAKHDRMAQRSDELSFQTGESVQILQRESDHWWIGRSKNGGKGYVPANYFVLQGESDDDGTIEKPQKVSATFLESSEDS